MKNTKQKHKLRSKRGDTFFDRRRLDNRRSLYSLNYFAKGGVERRKSADRRKGRFDRRKGWTRISQWSSIFIDRNSEPDKD